MNNQTVNQTKFKAHVHLMNLIKQKFNVVLEVYHIRNDNQPGHKMSSELINETFRAATIVEAYANIQDSKSRINLLGRGVAECSWKDQFVRAKGLEVALRRLYREMNATHNES